MCTYLTSTVALEGSALRGADEWFAAKRAVVAFDHPQDALLEHALCVDVMGTDGQRVAVELDAVSARSLAESILAVLDSEESKALR